MCVCVFISVCVPKEPVGGGAPVGDVIEEDLQLVVIVKVCSNNGANWGRHGKLLGCYVLREKKQTHGTSVKHTRTQKYTHTHTHAYMYRSQTHAGVFSMGRNA